MNIFSLRYEYSILTEVKNGARYEKEHPKISDLTTFDGYCFKRKGMVWIGGTGFPSIHTTFKLS